MTSSGCKHIRIFVSSPSDVFPERERVERVAQRLNAAFAGTVVIETIRWETDYYTADSTFQAQIADPGACEVVVSIFWQRLGSELPPEFEKMQDGRPYPSGTVYELTQALRARAKSSTGFPDVLVYRKVADVAVPMTDIERYRQAHEQRQAFLAFWEEWFVSAHGHFKAAYNSFKTPDEFETAFEAHLRAWLKDHGYVARVSAWPLAEKGSPFRSLEPFEAEHEEIFFGRMRDIDRALERLGRQTAEAGKNRFLLLIGESGSGKSSLARAGIVPRILRGALGGEAGAWRAAVMRPSEAADPIASLAQALFASGALPQLAAGDFSSPAALASLLGSGSPAAVAPILQAIKRASAELQQRLGRDEPPGGGLVLLIDQCEELFAPSLERAAAERFGCLLGELAATGQVVVVATLRSDAYAAFARSPSLLALKEAGDTLDVTTPDAAEVAEIVRGPAKAAGLSFGPAEADERLDEVVVRAASGRDALPLLQFTLARLYESMRDRLAASGQTLGAATLDDLVLTYADYRAFGGLEGAIGERAELAFAALHAGAQKALPRLLRALAEIEPSSGAAARAGGIRLFDAPLQSLAGDPAMAALVDALVGSRILVASQEGDGGRVRLAHEAVLRTWRRASDIVAQDREFFRIRAEVTAAQTRYARHKADHPGRSADAFLLPRGIPLAEAESIRTRFADELSPEVIAFIDQSGRRARRRQHLLAAASVIFAFTAVAAGIAAVFAWQSQLRASRNFDLAIAQADGLVSNISDELKDLSISRDALRRVLVAIEKQFEQIARIDAQHPRLLLSRAHMLTAFVDNYIELGELSEADRRAHECVAIARPLAEAEPRKPEFVAGLGACLDRLGTARRERGQLDEAIAAYQDSIETRRRLVLSEPAATSRQRDLSDSLRSLGYTLVQLNRNEESLSALQESTDIARKVAEIEPDTVQSLRVLTDSLNTRAIVLQQMGRSQESLAGYQESAQFARRLVALDPGNTTWQRYLSNILANMGSELVAAGKKQEALQALQESLTMRTRLVTLDPGNMTWQRELAYALVETGKLLSGFDKKKEALSAYERSVAISRRLVETDPQNRLWQSDLRGNLYWQAVALEQAEKLDEAGAAFEELAGLQRKVLSDRADDLMQVNNLATIENLLGNVLHRLQRFPEAAAAYGDSVRLLQQIARARSSDPQAHRNLAIVMGNYGRSLLMANKAEAGLAALRERVQVLRTVSASDAAARIELIEALRELAEHVPDPRELLREALLTLQQLDRDGKLDAAQKGWIAEIGQKLAALP